MNLWTQAEEATIRERARRLAASHGTDDLEALALKVTTTPTAYEHPMLVLATIAEASRLLRGCEGT